MHTATVKSWNDEEGWGVLVSSEVNGEIWAHFSSIEGAGYGELVPGQKVTCGVQDLGEPFQDGYRFRASGVVVVG